jgi:hypothetical protein
MIWRDACVRNQNTKTHRQYVRTRAKHDARDATRRAHRSHRSLSRVFHAPSSRSWCERDPVTHDNTHTRTRRVSQRSKHHHAHASPHRASRRRHRASSSSTRTMVASVRRAKRSRREPRRGLVRALLNTKPRRPLYRYKHIPTPT